ncbi:MAG: hypothetical protein ACPGXL_06040 [Chitinophagales bacterium]
MKSTLLVFCILLLVISCKNETAPSPKKASYPRWIGDIEHKPKIDDAAFKLCHGDDHVYQYFNVGDGLEYEGEKPVIIEAFEKNYQPENAKKETGSLRVRFIVNCEGETGRYRTLGMDNNYKEKVFDASIVEQIVSIIKSLKGWKQKADEGMKIDYYQYLVFKIQEGQIKEILP